MDKIAGKCVSWFIQRFICTQEKTKYEENNRIGNTDAINMMIHLKFPYKLI